MPDKNKQGRIFLLDRTKAAQTGTIWLSLFQEPNTIRDLVGGANIANPGGLVTDFEGSAATFNGSQQQNLAFALPGTRPDNIIVAARIKATGTQASNPGAAFGIYASSGNQTGIGVGFDTSNNVGHAYLDSIGAGVSARSAGAQNIYYTVFAQRLSNTNAYAWINGKPATTSQGVPNSGSIATVNEICIGAQHRSAGFLRQFKGNIEWAALLYLPLGQNNPMPDAYAEALYNSNYPYSLEAKPNRIWVAGTSSGSTGTVAVTNANDTSSASGTTTVTGSVAKSNANDTSAASGTTTITGSLARTNVNDTSAASGTTTVTGTLATTNANDTSNASGSVGNSVSGTVAVTNANDTSAASGTTTIVGTAARTNANDTSTASGTTTIVGTVAYTNANDTATASGVAGTVSGTVAYVNNNDIITASGSAGPVSEAGRLGGFEYGSKVYIKRNKKIYIFDSVEEADSYIEAESKVEEIVQQSNKTSRLARKRAREKAYKALSIEPVESVDIPALKTLVSQLQTDFELPQWIARQDWQRVVEIYNQAMEMQDEEDLLLIL